MHATEQVLYLQAKFTKADVIEYYVRAAPFILPDVRDHGHRRLG
jgi:DNA primase